MIPIHEYNARGTDYLLALVNYTEFIDIVDLNELKLNELASWIKNYKTYKSKTNNDLPHLKDIGKELNLNGTDVTKQLKELYNSICDYNFDHPEAFVGKNQVLVNLSIKYLGHYADFYIGLNVLPCTGDRFTFPFIKPMLGFDNFFVTKIHHSVNKLNHEIDIFLTFHEPNLYLQLIKEKALLEGYISFWDVLKLNTNELNDKLLGLKIKL